MLVGVLSCSKEISDKNLPSGSEIVLSLGGLDVNVETAPAGTKATPVTSLASTTLYWGATMGGNAEGSASETVKYATESTTSTSGAVLHTGKYQTATPTAYNWYVSNAAFTTSENTALSVPDNGTDIVVGRLYGNNTITPSVNLDHIFARLCSVTVQAYSGYSLSSISVYVTPKTSGTYNLRSLSWTAATESAAASIAGASAGTQANDIWLVPGEYTLTLGWTESIGNFTKTYTSVTRTVTLAQNRTNNIMITLGGDAQAVTISTSLTPFNPVDAGLYDM